MDGELNPELDMFDYENFKGKSKQRQAARQDRKAKRQDARQDRKATKVESRQARKDNRAAARQDRKMTRVEQKGLKRMAKVEQNMNLEPKQGDEDILNTQTNNEMPNENLEPKSVNLPANVQTKAINYIKSRDRVVESESDPEIIAAQYLEERERQIAEKKQEIIDRLEMNEQGNPEEWLSENTPDDEDVHEMILEEEENNFNFTGDEDNFISPETVGLLLQAGQTGAQKYREKRFAANKKAFGMTKQQYDLKQAQKKAAEDSGEPSTALGAALKDAEKKITEQKTKEAIKDATPMIAIGLIALVVIGYMLYKKNPNS